MTHLLIHRGHLTFECACGHQPDPASVDEHADVTFHCHIAAGIDRLEHHANKENAR